MDALTVFGGVALVVAVAGAVASTVLFFKSRHGKAVR